MSGSLYLKWMFVALLCCVSAGVVFGSEQPPTEGLTVDEDVALSDVVVLRCERVNVTLNLSPDGTNLLAVFQGDHARPLPGHTFALLGSFSEGGVAPASTVDGKHGLVDREGNWVLEPLYRLVPSEDGFFCAAPAGFLDREGRWVVEWGEYDSVRGLHDGLAAVQSEGLWGFVDETGELVIEPTWEEVYGGFSDGRALLGGTYKTNSPHRYINRAGEVVIEMETTERAWDFQEGRARFLVTTDWEDAPPPPDEWFEEFGPTDDPALIELTADLWDPQLRRYGFINTDGDVVIPPEWGEADDFSEGLAAVRRIDPHTDEAMVRKDPDDYLWGFIDTEGDVVIDFQFEQVRSFRDGYAVFGEDGKFGCIDRAGNVAIPANFGDIDGFAGEFGVAIVDGRIAVIDRDGNILLKTDVVPYTF